MPTGEGLRLAAALRRFWWIRGYVSEGREWLAGLLAVGSAADPGSRVRALNAAGFLAFSQGDYAAAQALLEESLALGRAIGDRVGVATALEDLAQLADHQGDVATAQALLEESLALRRKVVDPWSMAITLASSGALAARQGDYAAARPLYSGSRAGRMK